MAACGGMACSMAPQRRYSRVQRAAWRHGKEVHGTGKRADWGGTGGRAAHAHEESEYVGDAFHWSMGSCNNAIAIAALSPKTCGDGDMAAVATRGMLISRRA